MAGPLCYPEYRGPAVGIQSLIILACILVMLYAGNSLTPAINAARDAGPEGKARFKRLHRRSVWLNALVLIAGLGLLIGFANRPAPRTSGISELPPGRSCTVRRRAWPGDRAGGNQVRFPPRPTCGRRDRQSRPGTAVDSEMIKEIESYYQQKRLRDLSRKRQGHGWAEGGGRRASGSANPRSSPAQESGKAPGE